MRFHTNDQVASFFKVTTRWFNEEDEGKKVNQIKEKDIQEQHAFFKARHSDSYSDR